MENHEIKAQIKETATALGFDLFGVVSPQPEPEDMHQCAEWLKSGKAASMRPWIERNLHQRFHPTESLPGAQSLIMLGASYAQNPPDLSEQTGKAEGRIARYALGQDYHQVLSARLSLLADHAVDVANRQGLPKPTFKQFVDSGPLAEKHYAVLAGLGFIGRNGLLIHPDHGSWFFLAGLLTTLALPCDEPVPARGCEDCTRCVQACPGNALRADAPCDANRCLSYWTIEAREPFPRAIAEVIGNRLFGCDTCQEVCPFNACPLPCRIPEFRPAADRESPFIDGSNATLQNLASVKSHRDFKRRMGTSPLARCQKKGWTRNILAVAGQLKRNDILKKLQKDAF